MRVDIAGRGKAAHLRHESLVSMDQRCRNDTGPDDLLLVIDIGQKGIDRCHTLDNATFQLAPFISGNNTGDQVKRNDPLLAVFIAIDVEGNANTPKQVFGLG